MPWQSTPYTVVLLVATLTAVSLTCYSVWHLLVRDREPSIVAFAVLMAAVSIWSLGYTVQLSRVGLPAKLRWLAVLWVGSAITPTGLLLFALTYTEREGWLTRPRLGLLALQPALTLALLPTAGSHDLMWRGPRLDTTTSSFVTIDFALGPWYTFTLAYSYLLVLVAIAILLWFVYDAGDLYRGQAVALVVGAVTPFLGSVVFFTGLSPHPNVNPTSAAFAFSGLAFAVAVFRYRFLDVVPVARDSVVARMRDGYIVVDDDDNVIDANPAAQSFLERERVVGDHITSVLPVDPNDGPQEFEVSDAGETRFVEVRRSTLDGNRRAGDLLLLRDITAQRRVERRYQRIIERASDIMSVIDADGIIQYQSPSVQRVLGLDPTDAEGRHVTDVVHPEDREQVAAAFDSVVDDPGARTRVEYRVTHADGDWRTIEAIAKNLRDDPFVDGVVLNGRDVTERKKRERELQRKNERLDRFASVVSHDLRNPIQVAGANVDLAEETGDPERFDAIRNAVSRMDRIVDDVLTLAREGDAIDETTRLDLAVAAEDAWAAVETGEATLDVSRGIRVDADRARLQRLFENLFRNAIEHGGEDVTVTVDALTDSPDTTGFFVADDGPGIPTEEREAVLESGMTTNAEGTGFGLAIVSRIAEAHGWSVEVTESESGGACFEFTGVSGE